MAAAGDIIRRARERAGLTQAELARRAGTQQSAISAYERGVREPGIATLTRILGAAGSELRIVASDQQGYSATFTPLAQRVLENRRAILEAIAAYGGYNVRMFGSAARGEDDARSDLDLLVDLDPRTGFLTLGRIARDVECIVDATVDIVPAAALRAEYRDRVLDEAIPL